MKIICYLITISVLSLLCVFCPVIADSQGESLLIEGSFLDLPAAVVADAHIQSSSDCDCDIYTRERCEGYICSHLVEGIIQYGADTGICQDLCCDDDSFEPVPIEPVLWRGGGCCPGYDCGNNCQYGGDYSDSYSTWTGGFTFFTNETSMESVTGEWKTDLLGTMYLKVTGDDILRGMYTVSGYTGYLEGNFTGNQTPMMKGFWWQEPTYQPPYSVGTIQMDFNETSLTGIYRYLDGTWEQFTGEKVTGDISEETEELLFSMPTLNWTLSQETVKVILVNNTDEMNSICYGETEPEYRSV